MRACLPEVSDSSALRCSCACSASCVTLFFFFFFFLWKMMNATGLFVHKAGGDKVSVRDYKIIVDTTYNTADALTLFLTKNVNSVYLTHRSDILEEQTLYPHVAPGTWRKMRVDRWGNKHQESFPIARSNSGRITQFTNAHRSRNLWHFQNIPGYSMRHGR